MNQNFYYRLEILKSSIPFEITMDNILDYLKNHPCKLFFNIDKRHWINVFEEKEDNIIMRLCYNSKDIYHARKSSNWNDYLEFLNKRIYDEKLKMKIINEISLS